MATLTTVNRIKLDDGRIIEVDGDEAHVPGLDEINLNSKKEFKENLSVIEQGVLLSNTTAMKRISAALLDEAAKKKVADNTYDSIVTRKKEIDLIFGRVSAPVFPGIYDNMTSTERIISLDTDEAMVRISNMVPDRKCAEIMDMITHRAFIHSKPLPTKTLQEHVQREGLAMEAYEDKYTSDILKNAGIDPETVKPKGDKAIHDILPKDYSPFVGPGSVSDLLEEDEKLAKKVANFNKNRPIDEQIPAIMDQNLLTLSTCGGSDSTNICMDDVCVKQQAASRPKKDNQPKPKSKDDEDSILMNRYPEYSHEDNKEDYEEANENADLDEAAEEADKEDKEKEAGKGNRQRKRKQKGGKKPTRHRVWNTTTTVERGNFIFYIRTNSKKKAVARTLAFLISHGLVGKPVAFFVDGDQNITATVYEFLGFCNPVIVLDWYHLGKKVDSYVSLTFDGLIEEKRLIRKRIKSLLWVGNVDGAKDYISSFDSGKIKSEKYREAFLNYLENKKPLIPCYALRKLQGLKNSSNTVERANNQIVSSRQKHRGMAWSWNGSGGLAELKAAELNDGLPMWLAERRLPHEFVPKPEKDTAKAA